MLKDNLKNIDLYNDKNELLKAGFSYLKNTDFSNIKDGKYEISGNNLFVNIQTYETKSDADFEAHKKYIDIQYIISGTEQIGVTPYEDCSALVPYDSDKDIEFLTGTGEFFQLSEGEFMVLYPEDAHKPSISIDKNHPVLVRKAVVKVRVN